MPRLKHRPGRPSNYRRLLSSPQWEDTARRVRMRDGHRCQMCGSSHNLEVHHLAYYVNGKSIVGHEDEHLDKLITLCSKCHARAHRTH